LNYKLFVLQIIGIVKHIRRMPALPSGRSRGAIVADKGEELGAAAEMAPSPGGEGEIELGRLNQLLGYQLRRASVSAFQNFDIHLAKDRISPGQLGILLLAEANPGINQTRVGKALGIDRSTLVSMIDQLESRGFLARTPSPTDRRSHALRLSRGGEAFLRGIAVRLERHESEIAVRLSADERTTLLLLLMRVAAG
jgi:DNA-binding MarR family transcriptional regulator